MSVQSKEELEEFIHKPYLELIYLYHLNPKSPDALLSQIAIDFKKFEAERAHNELLRRQNKLIVALTVVLAITSICEVLLAALAI